MGKHRMNEKSESMIFHFVTNTTWCLLIASLRLFEQIDKDKDSSVTHRELKNLLTGIQFYEVGFTEHDVAEILMNMFDESQNDGIDQAEFITGISNWITEIEVNIRYLFHL